MSTDDTVKALQEVYGVSDVTARAMLTVFKNYSANLEQELNAADIIDSVKNLKDKITHTFGTEGKEFQAPVMFSTDFDNVTKTLKDSGVHGKRLLDY